MMLCGVPYDAMWRALPIGKAAHMKAQVRGPYGSPFTKITDHKYPAAVIIGAGTGQPTAHYTIAPSQPHTLAGS